MDDVLRYIVQHVFSIEPKLLRSATATQETSPVTLGMMKLAGVSIEHEGSIHPQDSAVVDTPGWLDPLVEAGPLSHAECREARTARPLGSSA